MRLEEPLTTWAGNHTYPATVLHRPTSVDELADVVVRTPRLRAVGTRHCFNDVVDSAELVTLEAMPPLVEVDAAARTVRVAAGTRYGDLARVLHDQGWAVHNLASLPHISVAGAVATATHGSGDRLANLAAAVAGLELVTGDGASVRLTRQDPELAGAVVGLGALGVVTTVTLDVEPTYDVVQDVHTDLPWDAVLGRFDDVTGSADSVSLFTDWRGPTVGQVWRKTRVPAGTTGVDAGRWALAGALGARAATAAMHPLAGVDPVSTTEQLGVPGPWHERLPHFRMSHTPSHGAELQSEYFVPRAHAAGAVEALRGLAEVVAPLLLVSEIRTVRADDLWLSTAHGRDSVGLHFTWQPREAEVRAVLPTVEAALAPFDARPHWGKVFLDADRRIADLYPRLGDFRALAARWDPQGRFRNDYLTRHVLG